MVWIAFSPSQTLFELNQLAQESAHLQQAAEAAPRRSYWCSNPFQKEITVLQASFNEKRVQIEAAAIQHPKEKTLHIRLAETAALTKRAIDLAAASVDRQTPCYFFTNRIYKRLSLKSGFVAFRDYFGRFSTSNFGGNIRKLILPPKFESKIGSKEPENRQKLFSTTVSKWFRPGLTDAQNQLIEQFIQSDKADLKLNESIVKDPAVVKKLIQSNVCLRKANDPTASLLVALTVVYEELESSYAALGKKIPDLLEFSFIRLGSSRMEQKKELLLLLLKTKQFKTSDGFHFIEHCLIRNCSSFLDLLVKKNLIRNLFPIPPEKQIAFWLSLSSLEGASFLRKIGCNPNIRFEGKTPLMILSERPGSFPLSAAKLAKILLASGADRTATGLIDGVEKTAFEIAKDLYLKAVLKD